MQDSIRKIYKTGCAEIVVKKSRFIGVAANVSSEEEAASFLSAVKKQHYSARHNCYAYSIGTDNPRLKFSDDGEPGGTAGKPILDVVTGSEISDIIIVVTRYFGGTLLGTGGLVRAYTDSARAAVAAADVRELIMAESCDIWMPYSDLGTVKYLLETNGVDVSRADYGTDVTIHTAIPLAVKDDIIKAIGDKTSMRAKVTELGETLI